MADIISFEERRKKTMTSKRAYLKEKQREDSNIDLSDFTDKEVDNLVKVSEAAAEFFHRYNIMMGADAEESLC